MAAVLVLGFIGNTSRALLETAHVLTLIVQGARRLSSCDWLFDCLTGCFWIFLVLLQNSACLSNVSMSSRTDGLAWNLERPYLEGILQDPCLVLFLSLEGNEPSVCGSHENGQIPETSFSKPSKWDNREGLSRDQSDQIEQADKPCLASPRLRCHTGGHVMYTAKPVILVESFFWIPTATIP